MADCKWCANYYRCEKADKDDCFEEIRSIYDVLGRGLVFKSSDLDETARERMNWFFRYNYGFKFRDVGSRAYEVQLGNAVMKTSSPTDIIVEMARVIFKTKTYPKWHKVIDWRCFNLIDIETDVGISEEQVRAMFFQLPKCDGIITQIDAEVDEDGEATLYVYIENGDELEYLQETIDWTVALSENGHENSLSDENYDGSDVVIIYWGYFE